MTQIDEVLIPCQLAGNGMFPSEIFVNISTIDGAVTLLADRGSLEQHGVKSFLRATRLSFEIVSSVCLLPSEETDSGARWV